MDASDESYHGGGDVQRPMTIPELCAPKGPMHGVMSARRYRYKHLYDYSSHVWTAVICSMAVGGGGLGWLAGDIKAGTFLFVIVSLGSLILSEIAVIVNNTRVRDRLHALLTNPLVMVLENDRAVHKLIHDPLPGTFHMFEPKSPMIGNGSKPGVPTFSRSDGLGMQTVLLEFADAQDRMVFRLSL